MSLRNTIQEIQSRNAALEALSSNREQFLLEWTNDINSLYGLVIKILKPYIADGSIKTFGSQVHINEAEIGEYDAPRMTLDVASRVIFLTPVSRMVAGFTGRVDMHRNDRNSGSDRARIVREAGKNGLPGHWMIQSRTELSAALAALTGSSRQGLSNNYVPLVDGLEPAIEYILKLA